MYNVVITNFFKKQLKKLAKKNPFLKNSLKNSLMNFRKELSVSIGHGIYKIRLRGQNTGKSGSYRVYIFIIEINKILVPVAIYAKNEKENLTLNELSDCIERIKEELQHLL